MKPKLTCASSPRGADMGRPNRLPSDINAPIKLHLQQLQLIDGDYDTDGTPTGGGAYWGYTRGNPMYCAFSNNLDNAWQVFVRGTSREQAKAKVRMVLPCATFYR